ncbi:hypothetical protein JH262_08280 [Xanthomonas campestris pv. incanae]|uniref:hypothetical protein n=1 Tax=Xanthomonas campestris TaxID=339 RepID=UPI00236776CB|nr:hypothetical protein [Xanthomonas campestris]WDJ99592.1 hypothetical protein JH262_08280 [Xanthomonas campestris pv. incanae]
MLLSKAGLPTPYAEALYSLAGIAPLGVSHLPVKKIGSATAAIDSADDLRQLNSTTYYRVEGGGSGNATSQQRITANPDGSITINPGCIGQLCVSVGNSDHAVYYLTQKRPDGSVVVFEVDNVLHDKIMKEVVPQKPIPGVPKDPSAPKLVDPSKPGTALELPRMWEPLLEKHSSRARIYSQSEFLKEFGNDSK